MTAVVRAIHEALGVTLTDERRDASGELAAGGAAYRLAEAWKPPSFPVGDLLSTEPTDRRPDRPGDTEYSSSKHCVAASLVNG